MLDQLLDWFYANAWDLATGAVIGGMAAFIGATWKYRSRK